MLVDLTLAYPHLADWREEAIFCPPQASRTRGLEIVLVGSGPQRGGKSKRSKNQEVVGQMGMFEEG